MVLWICPGLQQERNRSSRWHWDCSGSASGASEGTGTAVGVHLAPRMPLGLQWECPWRGLTYAICSNPRFSKHSFHKYCNLQVFAVHCTALQITVFMQTMFRWPIGLGKSRTSTSLRKAAACRRQWACGVPNALPIPPFPHPRTTGTTGGGAAGRRNIYIYIYIYFYFYYLYIYIYIYYSFFK